MGNIFLIRQFIYSVPKDFDEAAKIDGAGEIRVFFIIILPQIVPVLAVVALFTFIGSWNDLLWPLIVIQDVQRRTLTAGLSLLNGAYDAQQASKMAAAVISI
ncbi:MAG: carbohydrate ABC transporter permease, partial [Christensenellaceae bacterium]